MGYDVRGTLVMLTLAGCALRATAHTWSAKGDRLG
jgi:hypothetical protein